jgi:uncharacterized protein
LRLAVRLTPKASVDAIDGWGEDEQGRRFLKARVRAAPVEGRANQALIALLSRALGVPKSRITLLNGDTSRLKQLDIDGVSETDLTARLGHPPETP